MPYYFRSGGKQVSVDDMPLSVYADIEKSTGVAWYDLTTVPPRHAAAAEQLAKACAAHLGVECPDLTPKRLVDVFVIEEAEDLPTEWTDGMPDPKAEGSGQETS